ncbi:MAG TPA: TolC family protein [Thermoanaerobacterales bacterium]|nr:TolC family protein [Thermoanaerobacterales bacterium]
MLRRKLSAAFIILTFFLSFGFIARAEESPVLKLTIEDAVKKGLENSIALKQVQNQMDLSDLALDRAKYQSKKLKDAEKQLSKGKSELQEAQSSVENLEGLIEGNAASQDVTLPNGLVIKAGQTLDDVKKIYNLDENTINTLKTQFQAQIDMIKPQIKAGLDSLSYGESKLDSALMEAGTEFSDKLNFESLKSLDIKSTEDLMTTIAEISNEVTVASYNIYKNQIALLIQKSYYDVLKNKKMLEVKQRAVDRAKKQYDIAAESYATGMKAKDDMLLAELYYKKTQIEYQQALADLNNAVTEFKKNINVPQNTQIELTDVLAEEVKDEDLEQGLQSGLANRLEMKRAFGQLVVNSLSFDSIKKTYPEITFQYKEAALLKEKARLEYENTKVAVESSIRQSYETMKRTGEMLKLTQQMVDEAKEVVDIASYKYSEGFGEDNSLLKKLDLESASGTIVEVLAAQENLADVEEKVIEIMYGYNLARMNYYNSIGKFVY